MAAFISTGTDRRRHPPRWVAAAAVAAVLALSSCGASTAGSGVAASTAPADSAQHDVSGLVDVGGGRQIYTECRGEGSPTVVLISGKGAGAEDWFDVLDPADPAHTAPGDDLPFGADVHRSDDAVLPSVARFTRVCTYDRPDVRDGEDVTTPRPQPHTVDLDVDDLHALLGALGEKGPYVLVPHSYAGLITTLYARTYPDEVAGLVMVDTATPLIEQVVSPAKLANWDASNATTSPESREGVQLNDALARINAAPPMPAVPAVELSADKPWRFDRLPPESDTATMVNFDDWTTAQNLLAADLDADHVTETHSGHHIYLYSPALVVNAIRTVVDEVR